MRFYTFYTPQRNQGQAVTVSYAYDYEGGAYRRTSDGSDGSVVYERGELDWDREPEGTDQERAPLVVEWVPCAAPREDDS